MSGGPDLERDDIEHDRHLRQALRHAPDADAAPPAALRELILREAQAKARDGRSAAPAVAPSWGQRLWDWIGRPRFAGALAGVMVIGFAGLLWRDRPPEEALSPQVAVQAPAAPAPAAEPAPVEQEKAKAAPADDAPAAAPAQAPAPRIEKPKPAAAASRRAEEPKRRDAAADSRGIVAEESTLQMPGPTAATPPAAATAPPPAPAPPAAPRSPDAVADAKAERSRNESRERNSETPDPRARAAAKMAAPAAVAAAPETAAIAGFAVAGPALAQLRQQIGGEATRWYWQRPGGPQHPFDNAVSRWLGRLEAASRGRWQSLGNVRPAPGTELQLLRDGEVTQRLQLTDDALVWERRDVGETLRAPLDAATLASLRQALDAATP
jgi:hypothetical protein